LRRNKRKTRNKSYKTMIDGTVQTPKPNRTMVIPPIEIRPAVKEGRGAEPPAGVAKTLTWLFLVTAVLFVALVAVAGFLRKWLWMRQFHYAGPAGKHL
jgi:nitrate reductase NapE component